MADEQVRAALQLLQEAGSLDLVRKAVVEHLSPARRVASGVAVAVLACSTQCRMKTQKKAISTVLCYDVTLEPLVWGILWVAVGVEEAGGEGSSACTMLSGAAK
ncbi:hypothetical protein NDU88_001662 [Pleurodeles waltl]|uniref:Uncharacterized protein n=1 Tax=Pleurodeles waltl TaxID=8319 RepID=A0AAV7SAI2_PLEWA|nr:hypothetical protein NDU88_001662 [Pleurodeles waltl]